jgi:hypothetical protein
MGRATAPNTKNNGFFWGVLLALTAMLGATACDTGVTPGGKNQEQALEPGTYLIPVVAWKAAADEPSMMASLVYEKAFVETDGTDGFIAKLNSSGVLTELVNFSGTGADEALYVVTKPNGSFIVTGSNNGDFSEAGTTNSTFANIFVMKLDANCDMQWARSLGGTGTALNTVSYSTVELSDSSIIVGGHTSAKDGSFSGVEHMGKFCSPVPFRGSRGKTAKKRRYFHMTPVYDRVSECS